MSSLSSGVSGTPAATPAATTITTTCSQRVPPYSIDDASPLDQIRAYRFHPAYAATHSVQPSLLSATYSNHVDPMKVLCPFELNGVCHDDKCEYQHERQYLISPDAAYGELMHRWFPHQEPSSATDADDAERLADLAVTTFQNAAGASPTDLLFIKEKTSKPPRTLRSITADAQPSLSEDQMLPTNIQASFCSIVDPLAKLRATTDVGFGLQFLVELQVAQHPDDVNAWMALALLHVDVIRSKRHARETLNVDKAVHILARALEIEANLYSEVLWRLYLALYAKDGWSDLADQATQFLPSSAKLWLCRLDRHSFESVSGAAGQFRLAIEKITQHNHHPPTATMAHDVFKLVVRWCRLYVDAGQGAQSRQLLESILDDKTSGFTAGFLFDQDQLASLWLVYMNLMVLGTVAEDVHEEVDVYDFVYSVTLVRDVVNQHPLPNVVAFESVIHRMTRSLGQNHVAVAIVRLNQVVVQATATKTATDNVAPLLATLEEHMHGASPPRLCFSIATTLLSIDLPCCEAAAQRWIQHLRALQADDDAQMYASMLDMAHVHLILDTQTVMTKLLQWTEALNSKESTVGVAYGVRLLHAMGRLEGPAVASQHLDWVLERPSVSSRLTTGDQHHLWALRLHWAIQLGRDGDKILRRFLQRLDDVPRHRWPSVAPAVEWCLQPPSLHTELQAMTKAGIPRLKSYIKAATIANPLAILPFTLAMAVDTAMGTSKLVVAQLIPVVQLLRQRGLLPPGPPTDSIPPTSYATPGSRLVHVPQCLLVMTHLRELDLSRNCLLTLPVDLFKSLVHLQVLNVSCNSLMCLPDSIVTLSQLRVLDVSHNHVTELPLLFGQLHALQELDVTATLLTSVPSTFAALKHLRHVNARGTPLTLDLLRRSIGPMVSIDVDDKTTDVVLQATLGPCAQTWNVGNKMPPATPAGIKSWVPEGGGDYDIVAIGLQESTYKKKASSSPTHRDCVEAVPEHDDEDDDEEAAHDIELHDVVLDDAKGAPPPSSSLKRASKSLRQSFSDLTRRASTTTSAQSYPFFVQLLVSDVEKITEATGVGNVIGNKGGVVVKLVVDQRSFCFVNCHLAAHEAQKFLERRNSDVSEILSSARVGQRGIELDHQFDHAFWMGDMNYRVNLGYTDPKDMTKEEHWAAVHDLVTRKSNLTLTAYTCVPDISTSDHKPVYAAFNVRPLPTPWDDGQVPALQLKCQLNQLVRLHLVLVIMDWDATSADDPLGQAVVYLPDCYEPGESVPFDVPVVRAGIKAGSIRGKVSIQPSGKKYADWDKNNTHVPGCTCLVM
ncbi:hypothetical protein DYB37_004593 [Aphanomyces astaci]|uniref:C3H1-type domain-containing protein n=1 Tax=Aphanomyces astaci TaxID=112090 RepID=A0A418FMC8_APHAT|nr:hypothetical protein DYB37_004593 [Aphanomyces astaci]